MRIAGAIPDYYPWFQWAYDASLGGDTIESQDIIFVEDIVLDRNVSITIDAGYDCGYSGNTGVTTINGNMTVNDGLVTIQSGTLEVKQ